MDKMVLLVIMFMLLLFGSEVAHSQERSAKTRLSGKEVIALNQLTNKIRAAFGKNQLDSALIFSEKMIALCASKKDTACLVDGYYKKAFLQNKSSQRGAALQTYIIGIELALMSNDSLKAANMLLNLSTLQYEMGDYTGAQLSATKGLSAHDKSSDSVLTANLYRALGNTFQDLMDYDNAIKSFQTALSYTQETDLKAGILNNIANTYRKAANGQEALQTYETALTDSLAMTPKTRAFLFDNYGFTLSKNNPLKGLRYLEMGLQIRESQDDKMGLLTSYLHLATWHAKTQPKTALDFAKKAHALSLQIKAVDAQTEALSLLCRLKENPKEEALRLVTLNDSIAAANKRNLHQAVGIRFRTEETERENLQLKQKNDAQILLTEKEKANKWALGGGLAVSLAALGIFLVFYRKNKKQKKEIEKQKDKVEHLQRELHHRLKNNLSFIDFFITLAKGKFPEPEYAAKLDELQNRINSMFEVHRQLYKKEDVTSVNARTYISTLVENVKRAYDNPNIALEEKVADTHLRADTSFPIGLIVNEFVTNSYKYAFPNNEKGTIFIHLKETPNAYHLHLADNGKGLPADFDIDSLNSFGMETIKLLTEEYKGTFKLDGSDGTRMDITFPK
ncbi:histidine kinase dimerization/phosphoacceptor domain -containing protein [Aequorivita todarodis]|uniref:tetratricopeptide repeat-containing sensor histidine kinase n=1 Tax=Aequorivita todarodis TaxID=2036821 RepID=UPI002350C7E3|nr:histidine kinase dimerization/phosphoacceptor domain -containing protein [Aequorivita todarodis]MDC8001803.1 histidine kinase dimerization/phosphoacceptor domain -containing protein [Aequorivita todarodis]